MSEGAGRWPLVGREHDLQRVAAVLDEASHSGIVLSGAPGVGKTRLADECLDLARQVGLATARAWASASTSAIPFGALAPFLPIEDSPQRPLDMLQRVTAATAALGNGQPLMLVVDDAHTLDEASATVVLQLAATKQAFVVATVREREPTPEAVTKLWKDGLAPRLDLKPLDRPQVDQLLTAVLGGPVDGPTLKDLWGASQGNPLFLRELVLGALDAGLLKDTGSLWRLAGQLGHAPALIELVEARLADLDPAEREALEILAVGGDIGVAMLARLTSVDALASLERKGLAEVTESLRRRSVRVAHPLYAETVRQNLPAVRALALNRALAEAVEEQGARRRDDVMRVAVWRLDGGGDVQPDLMLAAARQAYFGSDETLAARLAAVAVEAEKSFESVMLMAEVSFDLGHHEEVEALLSGLDLAALTPEQRGYVAMQRAVSLLWGLDRPDEGTRLLEAAIDGLPPDHWLRIEITGLLCTVDMLGGRSREGLSRVEPMIAEAEGRAFAVVASAAAPAMAMVGRCDEGVALADQGLVTHLGLVEPPAMVNPGIHVVNRMTALIEGGRIAEALATAQVGYEASTTALGRGWFSMQAGRVALLQGQPRTASRWFAEARAIFQDIAQPGSVRLCVSGQVLASAMAADRAGATEFLADLDACSPNPLRMFEPDVERARAWGALAGGDLAEARRRLRHAADLASAMETPTLEAWALHDLSRLGQAPESVERLEILADALGIEFALLCASHARALVHGRAPDLGEVSERFEALGAMLLAAEASAEAAAAAGRDGDTRASERWVRRARSLAEKCEGARTPALVLSGEGAVLTKRELEIATLAAQGLSSQAIADQLVISVRTVNNQLQRAYSKLGVSKRAELKRALEEDGGGAQSTR